MILLFKMQEEVRDAGGMQQRSWPCNQASFLSACDGILKPRSLSIEEASFNTGLCDASAMSGPFSEPDTEGRIGCIREAKIQEDHFSSTIFVSE